MWVLLAGTEGEPCLSPQSERGGQASSDPRAGSPASRRGARPTTMAAPSRRARRPAHTAAQGRMAAGRLSRAGGSCPWMLLLLFPSGRRSHLAACPQHPPPPGKDRALDLGERRAPPPGLAQGAAQGGRAAGEGEPPWPPPIAPPGLAGTSCCCVSSSSRCRVGTQLAEAREAAGTCQGRTGGSLVSKREEPARRLALPAARQGSSPHRSTRHANAPATPLSFP